MSPSKDPLGSTLSHVVRGDRAQRISVQPYLFLILQPDHPLASSARYSLQEVDELALGRASEGGVVRFDKKGARFTMAVPDPWMSSSHAVMRRVLGDWVIEDAKSKNGTLINGQLTARASLADGDLIELGHTFFLFRKFLAASGRSPQVVGAGELHPPAPGLATLVPALAEEFENLEAIAPSSVSVVIQGETGSGKEVLASAIHNLSGRTGPFVAVNCAGLPTTLVESELFGYRKGAFSGASEDRTGLIRSADHGTLFLDEIGDLPASAQAVLLRVLQEGEVLPIGATRPVKVDIRLLAATHRDLEALVARNQFRADLMARISGLTLRLPPLRGRREDLGLLVGTLLRRHFESRAEQITFSCDAARAMLLYPWPLNVRELEKCLCAAVVLARGGPVQQTHFPNPVQAALQKQPKEPAPLEPAVEGVSTDNGRFSDSDKQRRSEILHLLREHAGNVTAVARALGKARTQVQRWLKRYRIDPRNFQR
jgi:DNA-binding NtrC family response regulator